MLSIVLLSALLLGPAQATAPASPSIQRTSELDHVLLWGRSIDAVSATLAVKLGFQVSPGRNPAGVANRYVRMADGSYLELEAITRPDATLDPGMRADQAALHGAPGSRTFGLRHAQLEAVRAMLQGEGLTPTPIFAAAANDPDGGGPTRPPRWRLFAFERQPLSSNLFFIDYATLDADHAADRRLASGHPNGARTVSAIWLLSADANADREQLRAMGFATAVPLRLPRLGARGYCVPVGRKRLLALQPDGPGVAADALREGGPQVLGVSIGVTDLERTKRRVERGYETSLPSYLSPLGRAFLAPTRADLGVLVEFQAMRSSVNADACTLPASTTTS